LLIRKDKTIRQQISMVNLEDLVPDDHLLRIIEKSINFDFIYALVKDLYSEAKERPSIDPVVLIKMFLYSSFVRHQPMRQTVFSTNNYWALRKIKLTNIIIYQQLLLLTNKIFVQKPPYFSSKVAYLVVCLAWLLAKRCKSLTAKVTIAVSLRQGRNA